MGCCEANASATGSWNSDDLVKIADDGRCNFDIRVLQDLRKQWLVDHPSGRATRDQFMAAVKTLSVDSYTIDGIVATLDSDGDGAIDFQDAIFTLSTFLQGGTRGRLLILFQVLDRDNNGLVGRRDLRNALVTQSRVLRPKTSMNRVISDFITGADADQDGALSFEEFQVMVTQMPELQQHFAVVDAVQRFNNPQTGWNGRYDAIRVLASEFDGGTQENSGKLKDIPGDVVAEVLDRAIGLSPVAIGDFLAHSNPLSAEFARCYFARVDFTGKTPDNALRQASAKLCFPRESQQVERLITAFASAYSQSNPETGMDEDTVSIVSYAILMLNTDAHTVTVRSKMTRPEFVVNTRHAAPKLQEGLLEGIYERVQKEEIRLGDAGGISLPSKDNETGEEVNTFSAVLGQLVNDEMDTILRGLSNPPEGHG